MSSKRNKTIKVEDFRNWVNGQLARTDNYANDSYKAGLCSAWESVAHNTGNYKGYGNLYWLRVGYDLWIKAGKPENWDEKKKYVISETWGEYSRVYY